MTRRKPKPATAATPEPETGPESAPADQPSDAAAGRRPPGEDPPADPPAGEPPAGAARGADGPRVPNPFGFRQDAAAGVRLLEDRRFRQVQLKFAEKPSEEVRRAVREGGYRWLQEEGVWARQIDPDKGWQTRADAEALFERVAALIREEKGVAREHA